MSVALTSAPLAINSFTVFSCLENAAMSCSGVFPLKSVTLSFAPLAINSSTISGDRAQYIIVLPCFCLALTSAI